VLSRVKEALAAAAAEEEDEEEEEDDGGRRRRGTRGILSFLKSVSM